MNSSNRSNSSVTGRKGHHHHHVGGHGNSSSSDWWNKMKKASADISSKTLKASADISAKTLRASADISAKTYKASADISAKTHTASKNTKEIISIQKKQHKILERKKTFGLEYFDLFEGGATPEELQRCVERALQDVVRLNEKVAKYKERIATNEAKLDSRLHSSTTSSTTSTRITEQEPTATECHLSDTSQGSDHDEQDNTENNIIACGEVPEVTTTDLTALLELAERYREDYKFELAATSYRDMDQELQNDRRLTMAAMYKNGHHLQYAPHKYANDKLVVLVACSQNGKALQYASMELRNNKEVVLAAACGSKNHWWALQYASRSVRNDKEVLLKACAQNGGALKFASNALRADKEVVMTAAESQPESLKYALGGLNQDRDCLIKAGLWDDNYVVDSREEPPTTIDDTSTNSDEGEENIPPPLTSLMANNNNSNHNRKMKIVLSTKFSLAAKSSPHATKFTIELKKTPYIKSNGNFTVYSPNAFNKGTCDPNWTNKDWPCRGTFESCQKPPSLKTGVPKQCECCWRYSFRYQLAQAKQYGGFMIQVIDAKKAYNWEPSVELGLEEEELEESETNHHHHHNHQKNDNIYKNHNLGSGQEIETEMAQQVGTKIFRFFEPPALHSYSDQVDKLVSEIQLWYQDGCIDMTECNVKPVLTRTH